jgi:predicted HTH transcriptional regulator
MNQKGLPSPGFRISIGCRKRSLIWHRKIWNRPCVPDSFVDEIDDETVVAVEIDEIPASQKPCFYKNAGLPKGAYLRVGNTNRQMTEYEVFGYSERSRAAGS